MIYLTLGDGYSGVYASQVINVCKYLTQLGGKPVRLIAFISLRVYRAQRRKIKAAYPNAIVLPAFPGVGRWQQNYTLLWLLMRFLPERKIMARGILATQLALRLREAGVIDKVIFDGRGAYHAEWTEYEVVPDQGLVETAYELERQAVHQADYRLAVSRQLVHHWQKKYQYQVSAQVVVPCTLNAVHLTNLPSEQGLQKQRKERGYNAEDIILIYAGSAAGWQSFSMVDEFLLRHLRQNQRLQVLLLSQLKLEELKSYRAFPDRVRKDWLKPEEVVQVMQMGDYGLLIREATVTNQVASPTKFAEYLASGLKIIISPGIGDFSEWIQGAQAGYLLYKNRVLPLEKVSYAEKNELASKARELFSKESYASAYQQILSL